MLRVFRTLLFLIATISLLVTSLSCHRTPIEPEKIKANLIFEDALCTEAYLRLKLAYIDFPANVDLYVDKNKVNSFRTFSEDTVIMVENLLPKKSYTSYVRIYPAGGGEIVSNEVSFTTMDTTSHNFTWQIDTLGDGGGSVLYDVAIINDTLVYAVGEIYKRDSLGNWDPLPYNLVKWNGQRWQLLRIQFYTFCGQAGTGSYPAKSIFAFGPDDIWIGMNGSQVVRWNGQAQSLPECTPVSINKLWGENPNSIWAVGNNGQIAHYDGVRWKRIESGTTLDVYDIYGSRNLRTGETEIYAVAAKQFVTFDRRILRVRSSGVEAVSDSTIPYSLHGVWLKGGGPYYVVGSGIYRKRDPMRAGPWQWLHPGVTPYYTYAIRGNDVNDVFICGSYGELLHFNGIQFRSYQNTPGFSAIEFYEVSCLGNLVVTVGYIQSRAVVVIGRRAL